MMDLAYQAIAKGHFAYAWSAKVLRLFFKSDNYGFGADEVSIVHEGIGETWV